MAHPKRTQRVLAVLLSLVLLAACSPAAPTSTPPTPDLNPLRTEVAATVLAQVTQVLASTPSITPVPSATATNPPSSTPRPTASLAPSATAALVSGTPKVGTDLAQWVSQSIADDTVFAPGQTFTMTWTLKNTGSSTWKATYLLRYYSGNTFGAPNETAIGREVVPGGQIDISIAMKAPATAGSYRSDWVMSNEVRSNFKEPVYLKIKVAVSLTPTATPKP